MNLNERLIEIARQSSWCMSALSAAGALGLKSWCIGAGAIRNLVWDSLHGYVTPTRLADVDLAYFDASDLSSIRDAEIQRSLTAACPEIPWEVTNQAAVHLWFESTFGHPVSPFSSLAQAVASWPEYATTVGLTLHSDGTIEVCAPYGLDDLFSMVVRRNPARVSIDTYLRRVQQKRYKDRWPRVTIIV
ncbi:nucleotidyltransferase family protein [Burkholderia cenocepacia]|uniref:nucleotidyltransferase family protein n=1 Tax=Burkholderia TaxID=32008 RepID=UPI0009AF3D0A|nr:MULTISPECIES: nucleotidyltransferase family protein [Burkholderia]ELK7723443.1 nucleotidyltransferase family protein [Burkholderia cenocepacia]MBL3962916.1 nucleotidyltransferase family protein [Burkholderia sp. KCJ3K979]MBR7993075.1 nucleotidyltransferase family protein [Burkholderia cenocepacia]